MHVGDRAVQDVQRDKTNVVESINVRYPRTIRARGHFPTDEAAMKYLYLVTRSLERTGRVRAWAMRWKPAPNAFASNL